MKKIDLSRKYKSYYTAKSEVELLSVEPALFLSIAGKGDPSEPAFASAVQALYAVAYGIKFLCKLREKDFVVAKLEGLWSYDENQYSGISIAETPVNIPRSAWTYTLMIRMPDFVTKTEMLQAIDVARLKKKISRDQEIILKEIEGHKAVQLLHSGPFGTEPASLEKIEAFMKVNSLHKNGRHHEIYLSDFRKTPPEKLKTILREPIQ